MSDDAPAPPVGRQLALRRGQLDLTQEDLAKLIGVSGRTVSAIERGVNTIQRKNRKAWERALGLVQGTISRAYEEGSAVELLPAPVDDEGASDRTVALLEARIKRMERRFDEKDRVLQALERKVAELSRRPPNDPDDRPPAT